MLNCGKKFRALRDKKKKNILTLVVVRNFFYERIKKTYPPLQVKWSVPYMNSIQLKTSSFHGLNIDRNTLNLF